MIRRILELPDPGLRERSRPVDRVTPAIRCLVTDMFETMHAHDGLGLAAPQVGVHARIFVLELPPDDDDSLTGQKFVVINPEIELVGGSEHMREGCLSLPGFRGSVERSDGVMLEFTQLDGMRTSLNARGLFAQAIQHEVDHLDGVLFIDRLDSIMDLEKIPPEPLDWSMDCESEAA